MQFILYFKLIISKYSYDVKSWYFVKGQDMLRIVLVNYFCLHLGTLNLRETIYHKVSFRIIVVNIPLNDDCLHLNASETVLIKEQFP